MKEKEPKIVSFRNATTIYMGHANGQDGEWDLFYSVHFEDRSAERKCSVEKAGIILGTIFEDAIFADKVVSQLSNISVPLALLLLGAGFKFSNISVYKKEILLVTGLKGFLLPAGALALASMLGFNTVQMVCVLVIFGSPAASSTYVMAREFGADDTLSANGVIFSSLVSVVTIFFCVLFLRVAGYL